MQRRNPVVNHYSASLPLPTNATIYELTDGSIQITPPAPTDTVIANFHSAIRASENDPGLRVSFAMSLIQAGRWKEAGAQVHDGLHYNTTRPIYICCERK